MSATTGGSAEAVDRFAITSYNEMRAGAPHNGVFRSAWQRFTAKSNRITLLGATVGKTGYTGGKKLTLKLTTTASDGCNQGVLGGGSASVVNFGNTQVDIGEVAVTKGASYYICYNSPNYPNLDWITYWWEGGSTITTSEKLQALVKGYDATAPPPPPTFKVYGTGGAGLRMRTGAGTNFASAGLLAEGTSIQISCQVRSSSSVGGSTIWDKLTNGNYVSDYYVNTPVYNNFSPGIPKCSPTSTPPTAGTYKVKGTGNLGLKKRTGPGTAYPAVGTIKEGGAVKIACQYRSSSSVLGSTIWDKLTDDRWVSDYYVSTPVFNQFTAGIPQCTSVPPPPAFAVPVQQTLGRPGGSKTTKNTTKARSDPVNTATGAWWSETTDVTLPGTGIPFSIARSYNSLDTESGPMGAGWTFNLATRLRFGEKEGLVQLEGEDNQLLPYFEQEDGTFAPVPGGTSSLARRDDGFRIINPDLSRYDFATNGDVTAMVARNGKGLSFEYDTPGEVARVIDSGGRTVEFEHDTNGLLTKITLPDGSMIAYGYTEGLLTSVTDRASGETRYEYDESGRLTKVIDANGHEQVTNTYGPDGRVAEQVDALGHATRFEWDPATETSRMIDARGNVWRDVYSENKLVAEIDPLGNMTSYEYDGDLNVAAVTDARGRRSVFEYDQEGNRLRSVAPSPLSYIEEWVYNESSDLLSHTDGRGHKTEYEYDDLGNRIGEVAPDGAETHWEYVPGTDLPSAMIDPLDRRSEYEYDSAHNLVAAVSPAGGRTTHGYDVLGRKTSTVEPRGSVVGADPDEFRTTFAHDNNDRLITVTDPLGNRTTTQYDAIGNRIAETDANDNTTTWAYDAADHLVGVTDPLGSTTSYSYDPTSNLIERTDPNGNKTRYEFDGANRQTKVTSPIGQVWTHTYDATGNETEVELPTSEGEDPATISKSYDELNRLVSIDYSDETPDVAFAYDAVGNRVAMTDGQGVETYSHDEVNRLEGVTRGSDAFAYTYDAASQLTSRTYPDGTTTSYTYDEDGRMSRASVDGNLTTYSYDVSGNRVTTTLPASTGMVEERNYDRAGRTTLVQTVRGSDVSTRSAYMYDAVGNPLRVEDAEGSPTTHTYDGSNRITGACYGTTTCEDAQDYIRYSYDPVGNRLSEARPNGVTTYSYNPGDQLLSESGPDGDTAYAYDARGNMVTSGEKSFAYDVANRMTEATYPAPPQRYGPLLAESGALGYWRLGDAGDSAVDSSGAGRDGRYVNAETGSPGLLKDDIDEAVRLKGKRSHVSLPSLPIAKSSFTIEAWIRPDEKAPRKQTIFAAKGKDKKRRGMELQVLRDGRVILSYTRDKAVKSETGAVSLGKTNHIVATYESSSKLLRLYVDGVELKSASRGAFKGGGAKFFLGRSTSKKSRDFKGTLDELAVFNRALLANEVASHYHAGRAQSDNTEVRKYEYDGDGKRVIEGMQDGRTERALWDTLMPQAPQIAVEQDSSGESLRRHEYGVNRIATTVNGGSDYFEYDRLNSVLAIDSADGSRNWSFGYTPFGEVLESANQDWHAAESRFRFTGESLNQAGLYHLRARDYDAGSGRFAQVDPVDGKLVDPFVATYVYVRNRPGVLVDPRGEFGILTALAGAAVGSIAYGAQCYIDNRWGSGCQFNYRALAVSALTGALAGLLPFGHVVGAVVGHAASTFVNGLARTSSVVRAPASPTSPQHRR